ncbi:MAG: prephenate dehydrogenase/arogenate dehydrogenase family protein [Armatimonadetes bacterium]|nr:prephenate dehydrogenase/arogenate dehydrogenase family protein [Akkermansiaceae bacterium]
MNQSFQHVSILGGGLLGGSIALGIQGKTPARLWLRKESALEHAHGIGISGATCDLSEAASEADLLILAVPIGAMPGLLAAAIAAGLPGSCLVTDVGSVKQIPHETLAGLLTQNGNSFIGSHPMAGSEQNGLVAARADLFENAACLLTNDSGAPAELCMALEGFWKSLGCRNSWFTAKAHDELVARISHLPHVLAAAGARVALADPKIGGFGGGGLRDTTRVASGNPEMWAEILTENRFAIIPALRETIDQLREILATLEQPDQEQTRRWLADAKALRDTLRPFP